ncbi:MAG: tetratricopeptide repeat protein [Candidatus Omnitrophica bacterium]|nr:tetratricopeptide repeat protein [Candidatus Omnitrophota bacterium]
MNKIIKIIIILLLTSGPSFAGDPSSDNRCPTADIVRLGWEASNRGDLKAISDLVNEILKNYGDKAKSQASQLKNFPPRENINDYKVMCDVATALFIKAELLKRQGNKEEAKEIFTRAINEYPWAQGWDPSRGSYWSVKEKSQASIDAMNGIFPDAAPVKQVPITKPTLAFPGTVKVVNYVKYGNFLNPGTNKYHYQVIERKELAAAVGEGIYPNIADIYKDPNYRKVLKEGRLEGSHWDFTNSPDLQAAFYKWATAPEPWGVRLFYMGIIFEKAHMYYEAVKCYHAIIIHFPETLAWTYWHTPWYPSQAAIAKIQHIIRMHPELRLEFKGAKIQILNSFDNDPSNDVTITKPGTVRLLNVIARAQVALGIEREKIALGKPVKTLGNGAVHFVQYANGHWQLIVNNKPYLIKGTTYSPTKVGQSPEDGTLTNWMEVNPNPAYIAWMDKNGNGIQDPDEPSEGDFSLMKKMGLNTLRIYHQPMKPNKVFLEKMFQQFGFRVIMGDFLGKYALGSGANWSEGTDYENPAHRKNMMDSVKQMVMEFKDEPFILMWLLGNENNYGVASNADKKPEAYYKFVNEVARMIKSIDPNHPVAICNGDILFLDKFGKAAPDVDAYGANVYRGDYGFGSYWQQVSEVTGKPAFITEYGAPSYSGPNMSKEDALEAQAAYHKGNWLDILYNSAGYPDGEGNAIGGVAFEWLDEWWKNYEPYRHDTKADVVGPFPGGYYFEEWFGILGQGDGKKSPYLREPRKVYYTYRDLWNSKE